MAVHLQIDGVEGFGRDSNPSTWRGILGCKKDMKEEYPANRRQEKPEMDPPRALRLAFVL